MPIVAVVLVIVISCTLLDVFVAKPPDFSDPLQVRIHPPGEIMNLCTIGSCPLTELYDFSLLVTASFPFVHFVWSFNAMD